MRFLQFHHFTLTIVACLFMSEANAQVAKPSSNVEVKISCPKLQDADTNVIRLSGPDFPNINDWKVPGLRFTIKGDAEIQLNGGLIVCRYNSESEHWPVLYSKKHVFGQGNLTGYTPNNCKVTAKDTLTCTKRIEKPILKQ